MGRIFPTLDSATSDPTDSMTVKGDVRLILQTDNTQIIKTTSSYILLPLVHPRATQLSPPSNIIYTNIHNSISSLMSRYAHSSEYEQGYPDGRRTTFPLHIHCSSSSCGRLSAFTFGVGIFP